MPKILAFHQESHVRRSKDDNRHKIKNSFLY